MTSVKELVSLPDSKHYCLLPYQIPQVKDIISKTIPDAPRTILDATAHIGSDSLHFSILFPESKLICIDVDPSAITYLKTNIEMYSDPSRFTVIQADCDKYIRENLIKADLYYFDPPWGGCDYYKRTDIRLYINDSPIWELINFIFEKQLTDRIILKAPRNFAIREFAENCKRNISEYIIYKPRYHFGASCIAYKLILIT